MPFTIGVGTASALKLRAVQRAFERLNPVFHEIAAEIRPTEVESIVPVQPFGFATIVRGATHRATTARQYHQADLGIGIENGLVEIESNWYDPPCVVVVDKDGLVGSAFGALFPIPYRMVHEVKTKHTELGNIVQAAAGGGEKDPHKWLSEGEVNRDEIIVQAILCALAPLRHADRYA